MIQWLLPLVVLLLALIFGVPMLLHHDLQQSERLSARLRMVQPKGSAETAPAQNWATISLRVIIRLGEAIARSGALSNRTLDELRQTLDSAGLHGRQGLSLFVGAKLLLVTGLPGLTFAVPLLLGFEVPHLIVFLAVAAGIGLLAPDKAVQRRRKRYLRELEGGMPDALDMMVICGQAGLGMEASIERVSIEIGQAHPVVAAELLRTAREMQVNADTLKALNSFSERTGVDSIHRLATVLGQSMQYGTPMTQALRALAAEQRQDMLARFEAKVGRLSVLLTLPMIIFILPTVFLIVAGPAMVDVYRMMMK